MRRCARLNDPTAASSAETHQQTIRGWWVSARNAATRSRGPREAPQPTLRRFPLLLAQLEALDLAGGGARQVAADVDTAREFPRARPLLDMVLDRLEETL